MTDYESPEVSDLAVERRKADTDIPGVKYRRERTVGGVWERIGITSDEGARSIGRPKGTYDTLNIRKMDTLDPGAIDDAKEEIARELCALCEGENVLPGRILVVGLGNRNLTPDSLGPLTAEGVTPTLGIKRRDERMFDALECSEIAVIAPGVEAVTGIDTKEYVKGICDRIRPDLVIAVDALASRSEDRLGTTVQTSTTGIIAGSGLGGHASSIDKAALGIPVFGIGVPTVINSKILKGARDGSPNKLDMFVSPKEIDGIVKAAAEIISGGINQAFGIVY